MKATWKKISPRFAMRVWLSLVVVCSLVVSSCFKGSDGGKQFYGRVVVPGAQEFRWSDGGLPKVFDPARTASVSGGAAARAGSKTFGSPPSLQRNSCARSSRG